MRILLQPSSGKEAMNHYEDTIDRGVIIDLLKEYLSEEEFKKIKELNLSKIKIWGLVSVGSGKPRSEWVELKENDWVLFYGKKEFYYIAKIHSKIHNIELAKKLWGVDKKGKPWEYIYFIKEGKQIQTSYKPEILKKINGEPYKKNHIVQGAILLDEQNSNSLKNYLEDNEGEILDEENVEPTEKEEYDLSKKLKEPKSPEDAEKEINQISEEIINRPIKERIKTAKILSRNPKLSRLVKERQKYICQICGTKPFLQKNGLPYAEAHHQLELARHRIDNPHFMICVCPTCHRVLHFGSEQALEERKNKINRK